MKRNKRICSVCGGIIFWRRDEYGNGIGFCLKCHKCYN